MSSTEQPRLEDRVTKIENELHEIRIIMSRMSVGLTAVINTLKLASEEVEQKDKK